MIFIICVLIIQSERFAENEARAFSESDLVSLQQKFFPGTGNISFGNAAELLFPISFPSSPGNVRMEAIGHRSGNNGSGSMLPEPRPLPLPFPDVDLNEILNSTNMANSHQDRIIEEIVKPIEKIVETVSQAQDTVQKNVRPILDYLHINMTTLMPILIVLQVTFCASGICLYVYACKRLYQLKSTCVEEAAKKPTKT